MPRTGLARQVATDEGSAVRDPWRAAVARLWRLSGDAWPMVRVRTGFVLFGLVSTVTVTGARRIPRRDPGPRTGLARRVPMSPISTTRARLVFAIAEVSPSELRTGTWQGRPG